MLFFGIFPLFLLALPVVIIVIIVRQGARITRLEKIIATGKQPIQQSAPISNTVQSSAQTASIAVATASKQTSAPVPPAQPISQAPTSQKAGEEVSGRFLGKIGIAAVLIGVAFFLKYAFDNNWIGPAGRVMIGVLIGLAFLAVGQYLRKKYLKYSDLIMGGGIAVLYLSVFSAHSFYNLIDSGTTGVLMFVVTLLAFAISIVNATQTLALVSVIGAFATPFMVGAQENAMWSLFSYLTIINLGVLGISFFRKWPKLNLASFVGTIINFLAWYGMYYKPDMLAPTLFFCIASFLIFLIAHVARTVSAGVKADEADYILMGANALGFALMGYTLLAPEYHAVLGFASVIVAIIYMIVAFMVNKANPSDTALNIFLPGLAVVFLSVAVPMQFSGPWIAVAWFIEACVLYGIASTISNRGFQVMGVVVYILGIFDFFVWYAPRNISDFTPIVNATFAVLLLAVVAAYFIAYTYRRFGSTSVEVQKRGIMVFVVVANILTLFALTLQITSYHQSKIIDLSKAHQIEMTNATHYSSGYDTSAQVGVIEKTYRDNVSSTNNQSNTLVSILWTLYAACLTALGFARRIASLRRLGLILFVITAIKVVIDVWSLGQIYRIVSFIVFGLIALIASFAYAKYKDRLKEIV